MLRTHQARADEQHDRDRDLRRGQEVARAARGFRAAGVPRARTLQRLRDIDARRAQGGQRSREQCADARHEDGEREHGWIDIDRDPERQLDRDRRRDNIRKPEREQYAAGRAEERQQRAFRQQLPRQCSARRAERSAHEQLALT